MLKQLYIKNFTLIDELDIQLHPGFSVITGETGAGKSIILGAIGLLLGNRADTKAIKAGCDRCTIEAHFDLSRYDMQSFFAEHDTACARPKSTLITITSVIPICTWSWSAPNSASVLMTWPNWRKCCKSSPMS